MSEFFAAMNALSQVAEKTPAAVRAVRIFAEHVLKGQNVKEALVKTAEILAAESLI
jgi:hypothetical protein